MALLDIVLYPDRKLKKKSSPVENINQEIRDLLEDMADTMYDAPGVGLAGPQVGHNIRVIVVDTSASTEEGEGSGLIQMINPEVISSSGEQIDEEGCLSVPGFVANVKRSDYIKVKALDREGRPFSIEADDILSRVIQHEIDHLDGVLFFDRLGRLKRELLVKKINKSLATTHG